MCIILWFHVSWFLILLHVHVYALSILLSISALVALFDSCIQCMYMCTYVYTYTCTCICTYMYICTHVHVCTSLLDLHIIMHVLSHSILLYTCTLDLWRAGWRDWTEPEMEASLPHHPPWLYTSSTAYSLCQQIQCAKANYSQTYFQRTKNTT